MPLKSQLHIMVVDDTAVSRGLMEQGLEAIGLRNLQFEADGESAYRRLVSAPVHLVISDMNMPGMDGLSLLEALRNHRVTQNIGFILVTGKASKDLILRGQKAGMNNFIAKPFTPQQLLASIEAVTGKLQ